MHKISTIRQSKRNYFVLLEGSRMGGNSHSFTTEY